MHQFLYALVDLQHDLVLPHGLSEGFDGRDHVCHHYEIQTLIQPCIGSLNVGDEWRELLIVPDQHLDLCFVYIHLGLHHLLKVKRGHFVPHYSFLYMHNGSVDVLESLGYLSALLLKTV